MNKKVPVDELRPGMFVTELDRPWLDTPFLLQGFLVDTDEQLAELRRYCEFVYIDTSHSVGDAYSALPVDALSVDRQTATRSGVTRPRPVVSADETSSAGSLLAGIRNVFRPPLRENKMHASGPKAAPAPKVMTTPLAAAYAERQRANLSDSTVRRPVAPDTLLLSRPLGGSIGVSGKKKSGGLLKDLFGRGKARKAEAARVSAAAYGDIDFTVYEDALPLERELKDAEVSHERSSKMLDEIARDVSRDKLLDLEQVNDAIEGLVASIVRNPNALIWLTRLKQRDNYAYGHAIDVAIYLIAFGRHLGFPKAQLNHLGISGLLQDIGKMKVPADLLRKTEMLTNAEFDVLRAHVPHSLDILSETPDIPEEVLDTVATHHERYDGSGYPNGLKGTEIGMFGAMAGIVDCFQALISERPYAAPVSAHQAMQDLYGWRDKYFHGALIEQFIQCLGIFPVGTLVELNTGDVAIVVSQNKVRKLKPRVLVVLDADKQRYSNPNMLDLITDPPAYDNQPFQIRRALPPGSFGIDPREFYI